MIRRDRRPTIVSPAGHIRAYAVRPFLSLILAGCVLAFVAGLINTICIVGFFKAPISAATGGTSRMVIAFADGNLDTASHIFLVIISFVLGNAVSAALVGGSSFQVQRSYGFALILESLFLVSGYLLMKMQVSINGYFTFLKLCAYLVSFACGLQNGLCTTFSGAVIRTTHVTGILTDIGLVIGQAIFYPRTRKHLWKLKVLVSLYVAFCFGGFLGWFIFTAMDIESMLLPSAIVASLGVGHLCFYKVLPKCKCRPLKKKLPHEKDITAEPSTPEINLDTSVLFRTPSIDRSNESNHLLNSSNPSNV